MAEKNRNSLFFSIASEYALQSCWVMYIKRRLILSVQNL